MKIFKAVKKIIQFPPIHFIIDHSVYIFYVIMFFLFIKWQIESIRIEEATDPATWDEVILFPIIMLIIVGLIELIRHFSWCRSLKKKQ